MTDTAATPQKRSRCIVRGQVQGVGFRPFVFNLAEECGLTGFVRNSPRGVVIEVQGEAHAVEEFAGMLETRLPPLARITSLVREEIAPIKGEGAFSIAASTAAATHAVLISPDTATCPDCLKDIALGRRRAYPFTNCTNCGPRYTITRSIPYDRASTSMACFPMCPECRAEYENPRDRRFHAQPNACPVCGPRVWFVNRQPGASAPPPSAPWQGSLVDDEAMNALAAFLTGGGIAAIKGLGGFHLACDACNEAVVALLRERKNRPHKPFALMAANMDQARRIARVGEAEAALLASPEHPIVLCPLHEKGRRSLAPGISPDTAAVGIMLPYTPLHTVLFDRFALQERGDLPLALVMTSGNPGGEPICLGNREALERLAPMADAFLLHNRDILIRVDDSVVRPLPGRGVLFLRRARGYVPRPVSLAASHDIADDAPATSLVGSPPPPCVLGAGAELKNTLCLTKGDDAFVSQHIGDMANLETAAFHTAIGEHLAGLLTVEPELIVRDKHPNYLASRLAEETAAGRGIPVLQLQHHAAHAQAVLAENGFTGKALVFALDGTGLGDDGELWGGELLLADTGTRHSPPAHKRLLSFAPMHLPGGEAAIREPWRIAHALLLTLGLLPAQSLFWPQVFNRTAEAIPAMLARRVNTPVSTSCGRLFDAVSALLGLCHTTTYEGQGAIRLEEAQEGPLPEKKDCYPCPLLPAGTEPAGKSSRGAPDILDTHSLFAAVFADMQGGVPVPLVARRFHASLALALARAAALFAKRYNLTHVGLTGGCMQNVTLVTLLADMLEQRGLTPLLHQELPPGDGCISLGQAVWGRSMLLARGGNGHSNTDGGGQ